MNVTTLSTLPFTQSMSSSRQRRLESKKHKVAAFLQIAQLNDQERLDEKVQQNKKRKLENESSSDSDLPLIGGKDNSDKAETLRDEKLTWKNIEKTEEAEKKPWLEGEEYEALRRRLKERKKALQALPQFTLKSIGHEAEISMHDSYRTPLFMKDLQHLLLYALMVTRAPVEPSRYSTLTRSLRSIFKNLIKV